MSSDGSVSPTATFGGRQSETTSLPLTMAVGFAEEGLLD